MGSESRTRELTVPGNRNLGHLVLLLFCNLINDRVSLVSLVQLRVNLHVKKSLCLKIRDQRLAPFLDRFLVGADTLIDRKQGFAIPTPQVRATDRDRSQRTRIDIELNVSPIGFGLIVRPGQLYLSVQMALLLQFSLQVERCL